jgi:hypothetical protein
MCENTRPDTEGSTDLVHKRLKEFIAKPRRAERPCVHDYRGASKSSPSISELE